ncbi:MAG TPA: LPS export ABC transporter permease LptF [Vicinamibacteria bacterium]|nr:LPS export ABC transporter permease LptF [Vicinamibacteria bacterium]
MNFKGALRPTLLDTYIVKEMLAPTGLGLLLFTFILLLQQVTLLMGILIARSAPPGTILRVFVYLLPSIFSVTIPMAFLLGVLLAFGRLASDSEIVALRASGVSPIRLLRPVLALALLTGGATFWIMSVALPAANQAHRQVMFSLVVNKARTAVKPRVFSEDDLVPGMVLYVSDIAADTNQWKDIFIHDVREPRDPKVILARRGQLVVDEPRKTVSMHLEDGSIYAVKPAEPATDTFQKFVESDLPLPTDTFFPPTPLSKGDREMSLGELEERIRAMAPEDEKLRAQGKRPLAAAPFKVEWHKKFAIPVACVVFGLLGLGLSLGSKKEARSAAFALSIAVIFVYYVLLRLGEQAGDTGLLPPWAAMWGANIVRGALALALLRKNHREAAFDPLDPSNYAGWLPQLRRASGPRPGAAPGPARSRRPVVVLRLPRPSLPATFPGILDRYIARQYLGHLVLVTAAFHSIYLLTHFLDLFDDIQQHKIKGALVLHYYLFYSPAILHLIAPVAVLVATLATFGIMSRRNEITAMKAGGVSLYRGTLAVLALGLAASGALFAMTEFLLPASNRVASRDFNVIKGRPPQSTTLLHRRWVVGADGRLYNYDFANPGPPGSEELSLFAVWIYDLDMKRWSLRERLFAGRAVWDAERDAWTLENGWRRSFQGEGAFRPFTQVKTREFERPGYFKREERESDTLRFDELRGHIATLEAMGLDVTRLRVQLHRKPAFPLVGIVMTLIGIPFAFVVGRRGALYGIGISIVIAMVYWACLAIFENLGNNALLPPLLAAWAPNLLFGAAGLYLMLTLET